MNTSSDALKSIAQALSFLTDEEDVVRAHWRKSFIGLMAFGHPPEVALREAYNSRDSEVMRAVLAHWSDMDWNRVVARNKTLKPGKLIMERRLDHVCHLKEAGLLMTDCLHLFIEVAQKHDDPEPIRVLKDEFGYENFIWKQHDFAFSLEKCGPGLAPFMREELLEHLNKRHGRAISSFTKFLLNFSSLKCFAALLSSGKDIRPLYQRQKDTLHPHLNSLIEKTGSRHGQLALMSMEPDPVDIIGRHIDDNFYGMSGHTFQFDYPERTQT